MNPTKAARIYRKTIKSKPNGVLIFGVTKIAIGSVTLIAILTSLAFSISQKPNNVLTFVVTTSIISIALGIGILNHKLSAYYALLFFAVVIILSKILVFAKIISLHGALETKLSEPVKNIISFMYHGAVLIYFNLKNVKEKFR
ncbi:MAG: hypothetical protein Q8N14_07115 [Candidatus Omnitrophota bacterium]|nr:hypothetical protein [Candidatus Omnitrophota bacterium]